MPSSLAATKATLQRAQGRRDQLQHQLSDIHQKETATLKRWKTYEGGRIVGQWLTDTTRENVQTIFGGIGTAAVQAVFGKDASFTIEFTETERGIRRAQLLVEADGVIGDPTHKSGNSVAAVLSTVLRRAMILLHPRLRNILIADEPLYGIDSGRVRDMAEIDRQMVDEHDMQLVVITHEGAEDYWELADTRIMVERVGGKSEIVVEANKVAPPNKMPE